jgi:hypothetical protein
MASAIFKEGERKGKRTMKTTPMTIRSSNQTHVACGGK